MAACTVPMRMLVYLLVLDGDLADHDRRRANLDVAVEDGEDPGVALDLVADQVGQGVADRAVEFADDDLRLGTEVVLRALDQRLARPQDDPLAHDATSLIVAVSSRSNSPGLGSIQDIDRRHEKQFLALARRPIRPCPDLGGLPRRTCPVSPGIPMIRADPVSRSAKRPVR